MTPPQHQGDTGHALYDIATRGHSANEALRRLRTAVLGHTTAYTRSRGFSKAKLASLIMVGGDPEEATSHGREALADFTAVSSTRAVAYLNDLRRVALRHRTQMPEVDELCRDIEQAAATP